MSFLSISLQFFFLTLVELTAWQACLAYGVVTFVASVLAGIVLEATGFAKEFRNVRVSGGVYEKKRRPTFKGKLRRAFASAWGNFSGVLLFLIVGMAIGVAVYGYVPSDFVARAAGQGNLIAIPVAAMIGIPLYVRAKMVIPIGVGAHTERDEPGRGDRARLFAQFFGGSRSSYCNMLIEEVPKDATEKQNEKRPSFCCRDANAVPNDAIRICSDSAKTKKES